MEQFEAFLNWIKDNIVSIPLMVLIFTVGIVLTISLKGLQITKLNKSLKYMVKNDEGGDGEVSSFGALCISMAATLGTGKIIGVATAIQAGGPGALFWMIIAATFGMATKYAEGFLAIRFRRKREDGTYIGGPFTYIEDGMGKKWTWLAKTFAIFAALAGMMGIGNITQMNSITESVVSVFDPNAQHAINFFGNQVTYTAMIVGAVVTILAAFSILGGIKRISKISMVLVPFMAVGYFLVCIAILVFNITLIPEALWRIIRSAFNTNAAIGGALGYGIMIAMREGISKGIFSNEAGLGSAPIALASAKTDNPVRSGLVCMSGTFVDTMVLCLTIGLGIVLTNSYVDHEGIKITINAFETGLHINYMTSALIVMFAITTFAFTTIIGWNVYGEKCVDYLSKGNKKWNTAYKILYLTGVFVAPYLTLNTIWAMAEIFNSLMALPNLIALLVLSRLVSRETNSYFKNGYMPTLEANK